jgi:hypothetical protein
MQNFLLWKNQQKNLHWDLDLDAQIRLESTFLGRAAFAERLRQVNDKASN